MKKVVSLSVLFSLFFLLSVGFDVKSTYAESVLQDVEMLYQSDLDEGVKTSDNEGKKCCTKSKDKKDCTKSKSDCSKADVSKDCGGKAGVKTSCSGASAQALPGECSKRPAGVGQKQKE